MMVSFEAFRLAGSRRPGRVPTVAKLSTLPAW